MKKKILFLILFSISALSPVAGQSRIDSLFTQYDHASRGKSKADAAAIFIDSLKDYGLVDSLSYLDLSSKSPDYIEALTNYWYCEYQYDVQNLEKSIISCKHSLDVSRKISDSLLISDCASMLGILYHRMGDYETSIGYLQECYALCQKNNDAGRTSSVLNTLAGTYLALNQTDAAQEYILKSIEYEKTVGDDDRLAIRYGMASEVFLRAGKAEEALEYVQEAYRLNMKTGNKARAAIRLCQMGAVYMDMKQNAKASECLLKAAPMLEASNNIISLSICLNQLGSIALSDGKNKEAAEYFNKGANASIKSGNRLAESRSRMGLANALENSNPREALRHLRLFITLSDSLYKMESLRQVESFKVEYETAEKEHLIKLQEEKLRSRNIWLWSCIALALLFAIAFILATFVIRLKKRRNAELLDISRLKDKFLSIVSHDLRNPVAIQSNALHNLEEYVSKFDDSLLSRQCKLLAESSDAQSALLENLLLWGRTQTGKFKYEPILIDPFMVVNEIQKLLQGQLEQKEITFVNGIAAGSILVFADARVVSAVLRNIITNAIKFSARGQSVGVSADVDGENVVIKVRDRGVGINPETISDIGKMKGGIDSLGTEGEKGSGLGLAVCRYLLEYENSTLHFSLPEGGGTEVSFILKRGGE